MKGLMLWVCVAGAAWGGVPTEIACNTELLRSYLLKGREKSSGTETLLLCPGVANNCCVRQDQQRAFHVVNDVLPARLAEYGSKVRMALARLKTFHRRVVAAPPVVTGSERRRRFCRRQVRTVLNFPFNRLYTDLLDELAAVEGELAAHYRAFFCVLCDAGNHPFFEFAGASRKAIFDTNFCRDFLAPKTAVLRALNVDLVDYLTSLQHLVDCAHYVRSFALPFFAPAVAVQKNEVTACLNYLASKSFARHCRPVCERLSLARVVTLVQGDFDFLDDAANLFEKFHAFRESGNFLSPKLRAFFARFGPAPAKAVKARQTSQRNGLPDVSGAVPAPQLLRLWAAHPPRLLADVPSSGAQAPHAAPGHSAGPAKAKVVVDPMLASFYAQIPLPAGPSTARVFPVQADPIDFDRPLKTWSLGNGVNPARYDLSGFATPASRFYRLLFNHRTREPDDVALQFFLSDFTPEALDDSLAELKTPFRLDPKSFLTDLDHSAKDPARLLAALLPHTPRSAN